ncbi:MAG TPA: tetratricopeptide repeat protein [Bacteroidia bacterium]|jgi:serine phosphatase RsbU (regulator of sigma subunit)
MKLRHLKYFYTFFLIAAATRGYAQSRTIDSLKSELDRNTADSAKAVILINLSGAYKEYDRQKSFEYLNEALAFTNKKGLKKTEGAVHNSLGDLYWFAGDYSASSDHYFKALKIFEATRDKQGMADCYRNIGWIYQGQQNYPLTLKYYFKSLELNKELKNNLALVANYDDLSIAYKFLKRFDEALLYSQRTIQLADSIGNIKGVATSYGNLGGLYLEMENYDLAIEALKRSAELHEKLDDHYNMGECYNALASAYLKRHKAKEAIVLAEKAMKIAKEFHFKTLLSEAYMQLANAHAANKDHAAANTYLEAFIILKDSIYNENNSEQINEMSAKYESEKKELMISSLEKNKALSDEKLEQEKKFKVYLIIFCILVAAFAFFLFRGNVAKKKANKALSVAYEEIEIKNKDITDSINYSKRIQDACLPPRELKYKLFPDAFVLFKPKDIVSGDFYWYGEKDGKRLVAACDCTGHGVPGALMSMIGNNLLNQIVYEKGITNAGRILDALHLEIKKALKQDEHPENRDGMDIALVVFNSETEIEFAGAQRPLWVIREKDPQLEEIKGNKFSIGGIQTEESRNFNTHRLILENKDCLYIFSDGIVDQFGGEHGKKFMTKNLKVLFSNIHDEPMAIQESIIEKTIDKWKSNREQVDDILVIGIKI